MSQAIQFQPDVQAQYQAWVRDPQNAAIIQSIREKAPFLEKASAPLTAAVQAGILTPQDFQNASSNDEQYSVGENGTVGPHQGVPLAAKIALGGIGALTGGSLIAGLAGTGAAGAATAGMTPAEWAAGSTTVGGAGGAGAAGSLIHGATAPNALELAGKTLGSFAQAQANNRGAGNDDTSKYNQAQIQAQTARDADETQSLRKLSQTGYIMGGGTPFHAPSPTINGHTYNLPDLGLGPAPITPEMKAGAGTLQSQLLDRLKPGGTVTPTPPNTKPGTTENLANYGSLIASGLGIGKSIFGN